MHSIYKLVVLSELYDDIEIDSKKQLFCFLKCQRRLTKQPGIMVLIDNGPLVLRTKEGLVLLGDDLDLINIFLCL